MNTFMSKSRQVITENVGLPVIELKTTHAHVSEHVGLQGFVVHMQL